MFWRLTDPKPKPMWYSMGFDDERLVLFFDVHKFVDSELNRLLTANLPIVKELEKELREASFLPPAGEEAWGFAGMIRKENSPVAGYVRHVVEFNPTKWATNSAHYSVIPRSLYLLQLVLNRENYEVTSPENQLMILDGICFGSGMSERGISGEVAPPVRKWLRKFPEHQEIDSIGNTMHQVYLLHVPAEKQNLYARYSFSASAFHDGLLHLKVPGTCACIGPGTHSVEARAGFRLSPHNIDSPTQQLAMLAGLGKLCELVRAEQYNR